MKKFSLGFSPCPNDTFIFDALVNQKIDTHDLKFDVILEDVQTLNEWAKNARLDISKISYGALPLLLNNYVLLHSGGALGKGVGPLLVSRIEKENLNIPEATIAIPGENTTAHMLFKMVYPHASNKKFMAFNRIEDAVLNGEVDAGVIIHENRFTYHQKGLIKVMDLGEFWESKTNVPIPLGGIVVKRYIDPSIAKLIDQLIRESLEYAFANYPLITDYVKQHAQEMSEDIMRQHIDLYVNEYSLTLGVNGRAAVNTLLEMNTPGNSNVFID